MKSKSVSFYASHKDLADMLTSVHEITRLIAFQAGVFESPGATAVTDMGSLLPMRGYLICRHGSSVQVRPVPQRSGTLRHAVDQLENPNSVSLRTGGLAQPRTLISGAIGTVSTSDESISLYTLLLKVMRSQFITVNSFRVGKQASEMLDAGFRLTTSLNSPPEYDLKRPD